MTFQGCSGLFSNVRDVTVIRALCIYCCSHWGNQLLLATHVARKQKYKHGFSIISRFRVSG